MTGPQISVIIPAYNAAGFIVDAIESVLAQKYPPAEIIIIDDGSTDATHDVVSKFQTTNLKLIRTPNQGVAAARNLGIEAASGDWLAFLDADDVWVQDKLAMQVEYFDEFDFITGNALIMGSHDQLATAGELLSFEKHGVMAEIERNWVTTSSVCLRRSALGDLRFTPGMRFAEDYSLWLRLLATGARLKVITQPLYEYRVHSMNATASEVGHNLVRAKVLEQFALSMPPNSKLSKSAQSAASLSYLSYCQDELRHKRYAVPTILQLAGGGTPYQVAPTQVFLLALKGLVRAAARRLPRGANNHE